MSQDQAPLPTEGIHDTRGPSSEKYIGCILGRPGTKAMTLARFAEYWNQVTPEDSGKWGEVEPKQDQYKWERLKESYDFAMARGYPFKGHCLAWGKQSALWLGTLKTDKQKRDEIEEWIKENFRRFPGMDSMDVVNEPVNTPATWKIYIGDGQGTTWDWAIWVYKKAKKYRDQYAPQCKLLINEYNVINGDILDEYLDCINAIQKAGEENNEKLLDGIGVQCHSSNVGGTVNVDNMVNNLNSLAKTGLPIYLSEFDIGASTEDAQESRYKQVFPRLFEHPAVKGVTFWGYVEGQMWDQSTNAFLLNNDNTERKALKWLRENYLRPRAVVKCSENEYYQYLYPITGGPNCVYFNSPPISITYYQWSFEPWVGHEGFGRLRNVETGLYLSIGYSGAEKPTVILQERIDGENKQRWILERLRNGTVRFKNSRCNKYLTAEQPASTKSFPKLFCQTKDENLDSQLWRFR